MHARDEIVIALTFYSDAQSFSLVGVFKINREYQFIVIYILVTSSTLICAWQKCDQIYKGWRYTYLPT